MKQGGKSRTALALGCALAMLAAIAAIAPAFAGAQAAVEEYELGELPSPDGDEPTQQSSNDDSGGSAGGGASTPGSTGSGSDPTSGAPGSGGEGQRGGENAGSGGEPKTEGITPTSSEQTPVVTSEPSDGGGAPVLLIALAVIAAVCTGLAIWRLRRNTGDQSAGVGLSETSAKSAPSKS